jgi:hypothetical protein
MGRPIPDMTAAEVQKFISKINFAGSMDCWVFSTSKGYAQFPVQSFWYPAPRISFKVFTGIDPLDKLICHRCDNPPCVNPNHLYAGTPRENARDVIVRKRNITIPRGWDINRPVIRAKYLAMQAEKRAKAR